jgi:triosephosphate isomerase
MYKTRAEAAAYCRELVPLVAGADDRDVLVCAPFTALATVLEETAGSAVMVGAQTMAAAEHGAFTGEVSPLMLRDLAVPWVILGHSERRALFAETDAALAEKVRSALDHGLLPILCVGETLAEREAGLTGERVSAQIDTDLALLQEADLPRLTVAYEPVWAIGTGRTATPEQAQETIAFIRERLRELLGPGADGVRILYGGSVNAGTIDAIMAEPDIDGVLVGGASLEAQQFARIVHFVELVK